MACYYRIPDISTNFHLVIMTIDCDAAFVFSDLEYSVVTVEGGGAISGLASCEPSAETILIEELAWVRHPIHSLEEKHAIGVHSFKLINLYLFLLFLF